MVEFLVTVAILIIVLAIAVPSFREFMLNNRQVTQVNELLGSLNLARAKAVKRGSDAIACITDGGSPPDCAAGTAWEQGWIVFADDNGDNYLGGGEDLIQCREALPGGMILLGTVNNVENRVIFNQRGSSGSSGTLRLCDPRGAAEARGIVVLGTGRARVATDTDTPADGIVDDGGGNNLSCP